MKTTRKQLLILVAVVAVMVAALAVSAFAYVSWDEATSSFPVERIPHMLISTLPTGYRSRLKTQRMPMVTALTQARETWSEVTNPSELTSMSPRALL